jgi:hypothetical protein
MGRGYLDVPHSTVVAEGALGVRTAGLVGLGLLGVVVVWKTPESSFLGSLCSYN